MIRHETAKRSMTNKRRNGFTLIEFVISTFVVAVALLVSMVVAKEMSAQMRSEHHRIGSQDNARVALDEITRLLRGAGSQTDQSRGQKRFVFGGPFTISFNANLTPIDDADGQGLPMAVDADFANAKVPLSGGQSYAPTRTFATGAETIVLTLDTNRDGYLSSSDAADDEEEESDNPRDFVLKSYVYGSDGTANTVEETGLAVLRGPVKDNNNRFPEPLFQYWLDDDNDRSTAPVLHGDSNSDGQLSQAEIGNITAVGFADLGSIERVEVTATSESASKGDADDYQATKLTSTVSFRNENNTAARVVGKVFHDTNQNGVKDADEVPLSDVIVRCSNGYETKSSIKGAYTFALTPGTYSILEADPHGYKSTTPNTVSITLAPGEISQVNFGDVSESGTGVIHGKVYNDLNDNGLIDTGEGGLAGVRVFLDTGAFDRTDSLGTFSFAVSVGNYTVTEVDSTGYASTTPNVVDVNIATDGDSVQVLFGDFATTAYGQIQGLVYLDDNNNGAHDSGEGGIPNVTITLDSGDVTITDTEGEFSFSRPPGPHKVTETDPADHTSSTVNIVNTVVKEDEITYVLFGDIGQEDVSFQEITLGDTERALSITALDFTEDNRSDKDIVLGTHYVGGSNDILAWWNQRRNSSTPNSGIFNNTPDFQRGIDADVNVVVSTDLNNDGYGDIITGQASNSNNLSVWITDNSGDTMGQLPSTPTTRYTSVGTAVRGICLGDFDGDSNTDMAVGLSSGSGIGRFEVWHGQGNGKFAQTTEDMYPIVPGKVTSFAEVVAIEKGDFNGDGVDDLVAGVQVSSTNGYIALMLHDPGAGLGQDYALHSAFGVYGQIQDVHVVDMMEDDQYDLDILVAVQHSETKGLIEVWHNNSSNGFGLSKEGSAYPNDSADPGGAPLSIATMKIDNDIFPDVAVGTRNSGTYNGEVVIYRAFGFLPLNGTVISSKGSGEVVTLTSDDFNKDGAQDIAVGTRVSSTSGKVVIYFNEQSAF